MNRDSKRGHEDAAEGQTDIAAEVENGAGRTNMSFLLRVWREAGAAPGSDLRLFTRELSTGRESYFRDAESFHSFLEHAGLGPSFAVSPRLEEDR